MTDKRLLPIIISLMKVKFITDLSLINFCHYYTTLIIIFYSLKGRFDNLVKLYFIIKCSSNRHRVVLMNKKILTKMVSLKLK